MAITGITNTGEPPTSLGKDVWVQRESELDCDWLVDGGPCDLDICGEEGARRRPSWFLPRAVHEGSVKQVGGLVTHLQRG